MKYLILIAFCFCFSSIESKPPEKHFFIPDKALKKSFEQFVRSGESKNYLKLYELADDSYKQYLPFESFKSLFKSNWTLGDVEILSVKSYDNAAYFILKVTVGEKFPRTSFVAFFWQKSGNGYRFRNFPFSESGLPEFIVYPTFISGEQP